MLLFWDFFEKVKIYVLIFSHITPLLPKRPCQLQHFFFFLVVDLAHVVGNIIFPSAFIVELMQFFELGVTVLL